MGSLVGSMGVLLQKKFNWFLYITQLASYVHIYWLEFRPKLILISCAKASEGVLALTILTGFSDNYLQSSTQMICDVFDGIS